MIPTLKFGWGWVLGSVFPLVVIWAIRERMESHATRTVLGIVALAWIGFAAGFYAVASRRLLKRRSANTLDSPTK